MTAPLHFLIIEDNPVDVELMTVQLRADGFHFDWQRVETETAYLLALEQPPDLILSDWSLPRFSGLQALQLVTERGLDIPFIIISGRIGEEAAVDALRHGAADYVWKDRPARLGPAVRRAFADKRGRDERLRAELALRDSEAQLRTAQQIGRMGTWDYDVRSQTITWSHQTYVLYERDPHTGPPSAEEEAAYYTPEQAHALHEYAQVAIATGQDFVYDLHVQLPSGNHVCFAARMHPMMDAHGRVIRLFGTVQDITERTQAADALRASERHYQTLAEIAPVGIFRTTADGLTTYVNSRWCAIAGISVDTALGNGWLAAVHPDDRAHLSATWQAAIQTQNMSWADYRFLHPDGRMTWVIGQAIPEKDQHGRLLSYVGTITDITARKQAEEALRVSEARLAGIIESAMDAIISVDAAQQIILFNPAAEQVFQCLASDAVGQSINRFISGGDQHAYQGSMPQFGRTGEANRIMSQHDSMTGLRWNGEEFPIEASISQTPAGEQQVSTVILRDITERTRAEAHTRLTNRAIESATEGIVITDFNQRDNPIIFANQAFALITGYTHEEVIGSNCRFLQGKDTDQTTIAEIRQSIVLQEIFEGDILNYKKDGTPFWNFLRISPILDANGQCTHVVGFQTDITDRKQAEEALRKLHERFELIGEAANDAVWEWDLETNVVWSNLTHQELFGLTLSDPVPDDQEWKRRLHPDQREQIYQSLQDARASTDTIWHAEYQLKTENKGWMSIYARTYIERNAEGKAVRMIGSMMDITLRKQTEEALTNERNLLRTLIDNLPDAIYVKDRDGRFLLKNHTNARNMGAASPDETIGKNDFDYYSPELAAQYQADDHAVLHSGLTIINREEPIVTSTGRTGWVSTTKVPLHDHQGHIIGLVGIGHDITARKQTERALQEERTLLEQRVEARTAELRIANAELTRAAQLKDEFLASMSHELRTPLTAVLGIAEVLQDGVYGPLSERQRTALQRIEESGQHLLNLINEG